MQKNSSFSYPLTGIVMIGVLVGTIFILRWLGPKIPRVDASFERAKGPVSATIQVIEYSDFQCPACREAQPELSDLLTLHKEKIRLIYRHFPIDGHRWSALAHQAAECAAEQNQFWSYHDRLYREQPYWSIATEVPLETFVRYAKEARLDLDRFSRCLSDPAVNRKIQAERSAGVGLGVRSTPSFFVNGNLVVSIKSLREKLEQLTR